MLETLVSQNSSLIRAYDNSLTKDKIQSVLSNVQTNSPVSGQNLMDSDAPILIAVSVSALNLTVLVSIGIGTIQQLSFTDT